MSRFIQSSLNRIVRNPNIISKTVLNENKVSDIFMNNVKLLHDPQSGRKLILVGTFNASNVLAQRTKKLIEMSNPDQVLVEADQEWFDKIHRVGHENKELSNKEVQALTDGFSFSVGNYKNNLRNLIFKSKLYPWLFIANNIFPLNDENASAFRPGLEVFRAAEWAYHNKKDIIFSGRFFNESVIEEMKNEKRMHVVPIMLRALFGKNTGVWDSEYRSYTDICSVHGIDAFSESADDFKINWLIQIYSKMAPYQKKIFIDNEDERLFKLIFNQMTGKINMAVVNFWHLPGIEHHWRKSTNTVEHLEQINPIGDFDIDNLITHAEFNDFLRRDKSKNSRSEPTVTSAYLTQYNKQNTEAERERHAFFLGYDDPELEHSLYNGENDHVKNMPYKVHHH